MKLASCEKFLKYNFYLFLESFIGTYNSPTPVTSNSVGEKKEEYINCEGIVVREKPFDPHDFPHLGI